MGNTDREACGRCSMSSVVDTAEAGKDGESRDPYGDARIEVPDDQLRAVSRPAIWAGRVKHRLDEVATRLTYGR